MTLNIPEQSAVEKPTTLRFAFIDALRGIAAFAVLFHHMLHSSVMEVTLRRILPMPIKTISHYGADGVQVFFVLSGFVIAHSLRNVDGSAVTIRNFILRRQIRLDPVLWVVLILTLCVDRIRLAIPSLHAQAMPTIGDIVKTVLYLQNILHGHEIIRVAWTLCIEVQFYFVFIILITARRLRDPASRLSMVSGFTAFITLTFGLGIAALLYSFLISPQSPYFIAYWHYFVAGVICYYSLQKRVPDWFFCLFMAAFIVFTIINPTPEQVVGIVTALSIYTVGRVGHLTDWLNIKPLQYLGRISYSLYLIHLLVAMSVLQFGYKVTHENQPMSLFWFMLAGTLSIVAAHLLYTFVEKPSLALSEKLKYRSVNLKAGVQSGPPDLQPVGLERP